MIILISYTYERWNSLLLGRLMHPLFAIRELLFIKSHTNHCPGNKPFFLSSALQYMIINFIGYLAKVTVSPMYQAAESNSICSLDVADPYRVTQHISFPLCSGAICDPFWYLCRFQQDLFWMCDTMRWDWTELYYRLPSRRAFGGCVGGERRHFCADSERYCTTLDFSEMCGSVA